MVRTSSCSCGQLKVSVDGEPTIISICHCLDCQQQTGSAFSVKARFHRDNVIFSGTSTEYIRTADSGNKLHFFFCPKCGSTVHYYQDTYPDIVAVPMGGFADPKLFDSPDRSIYEQRKFPWLHITGDAIEHID